MIFFIDRADLQQDFQFFKPLDYEMNARNTNLSLLPHKVSKPGIWGKTGTVNCLQNLFKSKSKSNSIYSFT